MVRGTLDWATMERLSDYTHFTDEETGCERLSNLPTCIQLVGSPTLVPMPTHPVVFLFLGSDYIELTPIRPPFFFPFSHL